MFVFVTWYGKVLVLHIFLLSKVYAIGGPFSLFKSVESLENIVGV